MAECYIGEIRMFATVRNQAPIGWFFCDGSLQSIATYSALFALLGTTYGGDGISTFALPDYRSRLPLGAGQEGSFVYNVGDRAGLENVPLTSANMPAHTHNWIASTQTATQAAAAGNIFATVPLTTVGSSSVGGLYEDSTATGFAWYKMDPTVIGSAGVPNATHENRMPGMALSFIIAWTGIFPVRGN